MRYSKIKIEEIKSRVNIIEYARKYFPDLKPSGTGRYVALCCFHNDSNPSLTFYEATQDFYCFGCKKRGDVFDLVAYFEKTDFQGSANIIAGQVGYVVEPTGSDAVDYSFEDLCLIKSSKAAKEYICQRGLSVLFLETLGVKYSRRLRAIAWPFFEKGSAKPDWYMYRSISPEGMRYLIPPNVTKIPFNFYSMIKGVNSGTIKDVYVFEGVFDAALFLQRHQNDSSISAIALCGLASSKLNEYREYIYNTPAAFTRFFWCFDNDESGQLSALDLALKFIKLRSPFNYFYFGDYDQNKDYNAVFKSGIFELMPNDFLASIDYVIYYYSLELLGNDRQFLQDKL